MAVDVIMLTDTPLKFGNNRVVFNHAPGGPDYSRVDQGQVQFLADHEANLANTLGSVLNAHTDGHRTLGQLEIFDVPEDPQIAKAQYMVTNKKAKGLSVGIIDHSPERRTGPNQYTIDQWLLGELSLTPLPRDANTDLNLSVPYMINSDGTRTQLAIGLEGETEDEKLAMQIILQQQLAARQAVASCLFDNPAYRLSLPVILKEAR